MSLLRVDTAIGNEPEQMQAPLASARLLHGLDQHRVGEKFAVLDHQVDAGDVHVHNSAGADVEMPNLAVSHLSFGQSDKWSAGMNQRVGIFTQQAIIGGLAGEGDGIGFGFGAVSPAIENDENERFWARHKSACNSRLSGSSFVAAQNPILSSADGPYVAGSGLSFSRK